MLLIVRLPKGRPTSVRPSKFYEHQTLVYTYGEILKIYYENKLYSYMKMKKGPKGLFGLTENLSASAYSHLFPRNPFHNVNSSARYFKISV